MTKTENNPTEKRQLIIALRQLSEIELTHLLSHIEALQTDLQRIPLVNRGSVEEVTTTQAILEMWHDEITRIVMTKQMKDTLLTPLHNWDNEG
jgi:hypothetical protein